MSVDRFPSDFYKCPACWGQLMPPVLADQRGMILEEQETVNRRAVDFYFNCLNCDRRILIQISPGPNAKWSDQKRRQLEGTELYQTNGPFSNSIADHDQPLFDKLIAEKTTGHVS